MTHEERERRESRSERQSSTHSWDQVRNMPEEECRYFALGCAERLIVGVMMQTAAKAARKAAQNLPLEVSNTSQFRDLANSSSRIFGWNKAGPRTRFNQVVITQEQLAQIRALRDSMTEEDKNEIAKRQATPEGLEEIQKMGTEQESAQNMEQLQLPPAPPGPPETYEVTIRGDGGGVKVKP